LPGPDFHLIATPDNKKEPAIPGSKMYGNLSYTNARVAFTNLQAPAEYATPQK